MAIERILGRDPLHFIPKKTQTKLSLALVFFAGLYTLNVIDDARESFATLCKLRGTADLYQCWQDTAKSREETYEQIKAAGGVEAFQKAQLRAVEDIHAANEKLDRDIKEARSRVRLAESEWGKPYHGPVAVPFADHSVIKIPVCLAGEFPVFWLAGAASTPGAKLESATANGYWLFDVYHDTSAGKVYTRPPVTATLTTACGGEVTPYQEKQP